MTMSQISLDKFKTLFVSTIIQGRGFPKKRRDQQIFLLSVVSTLDPNKSYSEPEINEALKGWVNDFGEPLYLDHVALRRALVDEALVNRDPAGTVYVLNNDTPPLQFDPSILQLDLKQLIADGYAEQEARKQAHLNSKK